MANRSRSTGCPSYLASVFLEPAGLLLPADLLLPGPAGRLIMGLFPVPISSLLGWVSCFLNPTPSSLLVYCLILSSFPEREGNCGRELLRILECWKMPSSYHYTGLLHMSPRKLLIYMVISLQIRKLLLF